MRVAVIGAGFAGLAAAAELADHAVEVTVFEARDRVGGRVWSERFPPDDPVGVIERGAEFVLSGYDRLRAHATDAGLTIADTGMSYYVRTAPGIDPDALRAGGRRLIDAADRGSPGTPVTEVVARLDLPPDVAEALLARVETSCAYRADDLRAADIAHVASFAPEPSHRVAEGNQAIAAALATRLRQAGGRLELSTPVTCVRWDDAIAQVSTHEGTVAVDRVVLGLPLPVLLDLPFDPPLPAWKLDALGSLGFGHAAKLHVPLGATPGPTAVMSVRDRYWTWTAQDGAGRIPPLLHCFAGSAQALERLGIATGPERWVDRVRALRPDLDLRPDGALVTDWPADPWARGAYSAWPRQAPAVDDDRLVRTVAALHFAGEHTAGEWSGLMEGALRSGERAAAEILRDHQPWTPGGLAQPRRP